MDFMNRGGRPVQQNTQAQTQTPDGTPSSAKTTGLNSQKTPKFGGNDKLTRIFFVAFVSLVSLLVIAVVASMIFTKDSSSKESSYVANDKLQAVFLNGGQVYFGKITDLNSKYLNMNNIYYLRVNQQVQPDQQQNAAANDISLVKLGCELHGPQDSMVINREQVIFWENLKSDGQVAKAVDEYVKANPNGQNCEQQNQQSNNNTDANKNNTGTGNTTNR